MKHQASLKKIDNYYLDQADILGRGAFSVVYKGVDIRTSTPVAIKTIKLNDSVLKVELATKEVNNLQLIDHENVVKLIDLKKSQTNLYLVMEYCNGGNLDTFLKQNHGRLVEADAVKLFKEIVSGMRSLCENGMVHRDLKPANILIHNFTAKIADFGFSKLIDHADDQMNSYVGTPQYMSPQQLDNTPYTNKVDIWSLGMILYETLYGKPPYTGATNLTLREDIATRTLHFPDFPKVSHLAIQLITAMLQPQEAGRISWPQIFAHELVNDSYHDRMKVSLESLSQLENGDHLQKSKELSKIFFEENKAVSSYIECMKRENLNKAIINEHLNRNNMNADYSALAQKVQSFTIQDSQITCDMDALKILQQNKLTQENFKIFNDMTTYILHRRNKAVFFHLTGIYLYEIYFDEVSISKHTSKDLIIRCVYLLIKYAMAKLYKTYKLLKTGQQSTKFNARQWELFLNTEQRTHLLNFISFDFEMCQLFHDVFMKYAKALLTKTVLDQPQMESEDNFDIMDLQQPPSLFESADFTLLQPVSYPQENISMINTFLGHCSKKLRSKGEFDPILDGTIKLLMYSLSNLEAPSHKILLNLVRAKYSCIDWRQQLRYSKLENNWAKFDEGLICKTKEQLYLKIS